MRGSAFVTKYDVPSTCRGVGGQLWCISPTIGCTIALVVFLPARGFLWLMFKFTSQQRPLRTRESLTKPHIHLYARNIEQRKWKDIYCLASFTVNVVCCLLQDFLGRKKHLYYVLCAQLEGGNQKGGLFLFVKHC